jgi:hypothetical protein
MFVEVELLDAATGSAPASVMNHPRLVAVGGGTDAEPVDWMSEVLGKKGLFRTLFPARPGTYDILVPRGGGYREGRLSRFVLARDRPAGRQTIRLDRGLAVHGRVLDAEGKPAVGQWIEAGGWGGSVQEDGKYEITGLDEGPVEVRVSPRYARAPAQRVDVRPGGANVADFQVVTGGAVLFEVPLGVRALQRVRAVARPEAGGEDAALEVDAAAFAAPSGPTLVLPCLAPGRWHVEVTWDGRSILTKDVDVADRRTTTLELRP